MKNLDLQLKCDRFDRTVISHKYTSYPLCVSRPFRLDRNNSKCAYIYLGSTSPGLLAGDKLTISWQLERDSYLYLTERSATKVHPMPIVDTKATTNYQIEVGENATLEYVPEPLILYRDAALEQTTCIKLHPTAKLFMSEIILPGRLARGENYQFRYYFNRLQVASLDSKLWFVDATRLEGKNNPFQNQNLFASLSIIGNLYIVVPALNLEKLQENLEIKAFNCRDFIVASSLLPNNKGLLVRALSASTHQIKNYFQFILNTVRRLSDRPPLPYIPK